jgi:hypothetical protein
VEHLKGLKGLPGTNILAYCENPYITAVKSFIVKAPGFTYDRHLQSSKYIYSIGPIKPFTPVILDFAK